MHTLKASNVLIVEDDEPKLSAIAHIVQELLPTAEIFIAKSVSSAINVIEKTQIDIAILDMSLPTFDFAIDLTGGGPPQGYGGRDILRFIDDTQECAMAIIITQHDEFFENTSSDAQSLTSLSENLHIDFHPLLRAVIFYSGQRGKWKDELKQIITNTGARK